MSEDSESEETRLRRRGQEKVDELIDAEFNVIAGSTLEDGAVSEDSPTYDELYDPNGGGSGFSFTVNHDLVMKPSSVIRESYGACSCGWTSGWLATDWDVDRAWEVHCEEAFVRVEEMYHGPTCGG